MPNQPNEFQSLELETVSIESEFLLASNTRLGMARRAVEEVYALSQVEVVETPTVLIDNEQIPVNPDIAEIMPYVSEIHDLRRAALVDDSINNNDYGLAA